MNYLELTNLALREINEVPIKESQFDTARGLQQYAKNAVNRAYMDITNSSREWPWLYSAGTNSLATVSQEVKKGTLTLPIDTSLYTHIDWDSVYLTDTLVEEKEPEDTVEEWVCEAYQDTEINYATLEYNSTTDSYEGFPLISNYEQSTVLQTFVKQDGAYVSSQGSYLTFPAYWEGYKKLTWSLVEGVPTIELWYELPDGEAPDEVYAYDPDWGWEAENGWFEGLPSSPNVRYICTKGSENVVYRFDAQTYEYTAENGDIYPPSPLQETADKYPTFSAETTHGDWVCTYESGVRQQYTEVYFSNGSIITITDEGFNEYIPAGDTYVSIDYGANGQNGDTPGLTFIPDVNNVGFEWESFRFGTETNPATGAMEYGYFFTATDSSLHTIETGNVPFWFDSDKKGYFHPGYSLLPEPAGYKPEVQTCVNGAQTKVYTSSFQSNVLVADDGELYPPAVEAETYDDWTCKLTEGKHVLYTTMYANYDDNGNVTELQCIPYYPNGQVWPWDYYQLTDGKWISTATGKDGSLTANGAGLELIRPGPIEWEQIYPDDGDGDIFCITSQVSEADTNARYYYQPQIGQYTNAQFGTFQSPYGFVPGVQTCVSGEESRTYVEQIDGTFETEGGNVYPPKVPEIIPTRQVSKNLDRLLYDEWVAKYREDDLLLAADKQGQPEYVFMQPNKETLGITPVPDKDYVISYNAWKVPTFLNAPTDELPFADRWYTVLIARARYYLWLFRENDRQAAFAKGDYEMGLREMQRELLSQQVTHVRAI